MVGYRPGTYVEHAPAKVNLHLAIGPNRPDGFHDLQSIFQLIDLSDLLTIRIERSEELKVSCGALEGIDADWNTMIHAVHLHAEAIGATGIITIACAKHIPMMAGLGGGSSDGAAVLRALNHACSTPLSQPELMHLGAQVGSDVPFFLAGCSAAYVEGRGEHVFPMKSREDLHGLVVMPVGHAVSTAWAFRRLDQMRQEYGNGRIRFEREALVEEFSKPVSSWPFTNDFRSVLDGIIGIYDELDDLVASTGGCFSSVSGSGSAYVVVSEQQEKIERLQKKIEVFPHELCLYVIKCLHREHSGATVSI